MFFDQLHRYHRNGHLREEERGMLLSAPWFAALEQRTDIAVTQPRTHTLEKPCVCVW